MPDKKPTDKLSNNSPILSNSLSNNEIKKALEKLLELVLVEGCLQRAKTISNALNLINRLQAKVEFYKKNRDKYQDDVMFLSIQVDELQAENERLKNALTDHEYGNCVAVKNGLIYTHTLEDYDELIGDISAEAYKEFAERLKEETTEAIIANEKVIKARVEKRNANRYEDNLCIMCDGKISALGGIERFIDNLLKEKVGE